MPDVLHDRARPLRHPPSSDGRGWVSLVNFGLNQGPIVLMIENWRSGLVWSLLRECPYLVEGLRRAGFAGGWLRP